MRILGMSRDDPAELTAFREKYGLGFTFLSDPDHGVHEAYGAWGDRPGRGEGVIRSTVLIAPDWTVERVWHGVKADGHADEVLAAL